MELEYGKGFPEISIDEKRLLGVLQPQEVRGIEWVDDAVKKSLRSLWDPPPFQKY